MSQTNQLFIDQIQAAKSSKDLQEIWQAMQERAFLSYKLDPKIFDANKSEFASLAFADQQRFLVEVLDKNLLYVHYQVFIEPKGSHLLKADEWKENFLVSIKENFEIEQLFTNKKYAVWGLPFYNSESRDVEFTGAFETLLA